MHRTAGRTSPVMKMTWMPRRQALGMGLMLFASGAWWIAPSNASKVPDFEVVSKQHSPVISPALPHDLTLFGEPVPLGRFGVVEALDRELIGNTYRHSSTMLYLKRAARWFPVIEPILEEEGVPSS